jgi:hypothetical protein
MNNVTNILGTLIGFAIGAVILQTVLDSMNNNLKNKRHSQGRPYRTRIPLKSRISPMKR